MTLSSSSHSWTRASRATSPPCSPAGSSRDSASGLGIDAGNTIRGRPRTPSGSRVRLPKSRTVFEIPNGFGVVMRATATSLPPPGPWFYRCPKRRKTGPEDRFPYSTYLGRGLQESLAGMDGNRTHPGRLSSAPQTVLKTAGAASMPVHRCPREFSHQRRQSTIVRGRLLAFALKAVVLAVVKYLRGDRRAWPEPRPGWAAGALGGKSRYLAGVAHGSARRTGSMPSVRHMCML